eukprot:1157643-Pelagomonas_calceolata.AAC.4
MKPAESPVAMNELVASTVRAATVSSSLWPVGNGCKKYKPMLDTNQRALRKDPAVGAETTSKSRQQWQGSPYIFVIKRHRLLKFDVFFGIDESGCRAAPVSPRSWPDSSNC